MSCCANENRRICAEGADYVQPLLNAEPKVAVIACEGACTKGEIARDAANLLAYRLEREQTVRICLGDAVTADTGFCTLVERAPLVLAIEGCPLCCGTRILRHRFPTIKPRAVIANRYYDYDMRQFEIFDMEPQEVRRHALQVAEQGRQQLHHSAASADA